MALPYSLTNQSGKLEKSAVPRGRELFHGPQFAPVSKTAGRTRHLFRFEVGGRLTLVDLPGYGFAGTAGKQLVKDWEIMVDSYLEFTKPSERLKRIISLIDVMFFLERKGSSSRSPSLMLCDRCLVEIDKFIFSSRREVVDLDRHGK